MLIRKWLLNSVAVFAPPDKPGAGGAAEPPVGDAQPGADGGAGEVGDAGGAEGAGGDGGEAGDGAGGDDGAGGEGGDGQPPAAAAKPAEDWRDKELARKHRKAQDLARKNAALQQELDDAKALLERSGAPAKPEGTAPAAPARTFTEADVDRAAAVKVAQQAYDDACNTTFNKGKADYKEDWDKALNQLNLLGGLGEDQQGVEVMQSILATDDPAKVLYALGSDPEEYHRVMGLPPARRLAEIVKLGIPDKKPVKKPSDLQPPPNGISRRAAADNSEAKIYDDKVPDDEWYAIRQAQKKASKGRPWSLQR